jgi:hypothetical protein
MTNTIPRMIRTTQGTAPGGGAAAFFLGRTGLNLAMLAMVAPGWVRVVRVGTRRVAEIPGVLVNRIPEEELPAAQRFLEYLAVSPAYRAALPSPPDDEPVTEADAAAIARARGEVRGGKVISHDEILREFGLR